MVKNTCENKLSALTHTAKMNNLRLVCGVRGRRGVARRTSSLQSCWGRNKLRSEGANVRMEGRTVYQSEVGSGGRKQRRWWD